MASGLFTMKNLSGLNSVLLKSVSSVLSLCYLSKKLNNVQSVEECDAGKVEKHTAVGYIKIISFLN